MVARAEILDAMWAGDVNLLNELAGCGCCCGEHTHEGCPAREWFGCRGQGSMTRDEEESWADHYARAHGMSRAAFYGF